MGKPMNTIFKVGFLLLDDTKSLEKLLVIRELHGKPDINKEMGMLSIPVITVEPEDLSCDTAIWRLLRKEVGISDSRLVEILGVFDEVFTPIRGRSDYKVLYGYGLLMDRSLRQFYPEDPGIEPVGWMTPLELLKRGEKIRPEVIPIITHICTSQWLQ